MGAARTTFFLDRLPGALYREAGILADRAAACAETERTPHPWKSGRRVCSLSALEQTSGSSRSALDGWLAGQMELGRRAIQNEFACQFAEADPRWSAHAGQARKLTPAELERFLGESRREIAQFLRRDPKNERLRRETAVQRAMIIALQAQIYARRTGELPAQLDGLADGAAIDPFSPTGKPLYYRRLDPGHAVVWSVGTDGIDQNGDVTFADDHLTRDVGFRIVLPVSR